MTDASIPEVPDSIAIEPGKEPDSRRTARWRLAAGAGIGSAAIVAALLYSRQGKGPSKK